MTQCDKFGCKPRINEFGVCWCVNCGKLYSFNLNHKPLDRNFLIAEHKENYQYYVKFLEENGITAADYMVTVKKR